MSKVSKSEERAAWARFARLAIAPRPRQAAARGPQIILAAHDLARAVVMRCPPAGNPLAVAADMARIAQDAPLWAPCPMSRIDFERIAVDCFHASRFKNRANV
ncbi:hypothetical protein C8247_11450 [Paracidovorax avenae]|uniref:hypothetical protein n=1 Tax=Paracidovorax avenae TaxID=80867 RepID=UPI000D17D64B|nr:hypothetical protein [Paracidovorax avenae]AVS70984.1 hypothetical protein C8247_11450 [Paracidovorax avenae]